MSPTMVTCPTEICFHFPTKGRGVEPRNQCTYRFSASATRKQMLFAGLTQHCIGVYVQTHTHTHKRTPTLDTLHAQQMPPVATRVASRAGRGVPGAGWDLGAAADVGLGPWALGYSEARVGTEQKSGQTCSALLALCCCVLLGESRAGREGYVFEGSKKNQTVARISPRPPVMPCCFSFWMEGRKPSKPNRSQSPSCRRLNIPSITYWHRFSKPSNHSLAMSHGEAHLISQHQPRGTVKKRHTHTHLHVPMPELLSGFDSNLEFVCSHTLSPWTLKRRKGVFRWPSDISREALGKMPVLMYLDWVPKGRAMA